MPKSRSSRQAGRQAAVLTIGAAGAAGAAFTAGEVAGAGAAGLSAGAIAAAVAAVAARSGGPGRDLGAETFLNLVSEGLYATDNEGICVFANDAAARMLGTSVVELVGQQLHDYHGGSVADDMRECAVCAPSRTSLVSRGRGEFQRADGSAFPIEFVSRVTGKRRSRIGVVTFRDDTDRAKSDAERGDMELRYRAVTESANDAIVSADAQGRIISWSRGAMKIFGYDEADVLGKSLTTIMPERYRESHERGMGRFLLTNEPRAIGQTVEVHALRKDGTEFPIELSLSFWQQGDLKFFTGILRDITERKRAADALAREAGFVQLLQRVSIAANQTSDSQVALEQSLRLIAEHTGWPVGHIYLVDKDEETLIPSNIWALRDGDEFGYDSFRHVTLQTRLSVGTGLPGRVLGSKQPSWIADVTLDPNFPRSASARVSDLKAAFAFPVLIGSEVAAVLEFFTSESLEPDDALIEIMAQIGTQLGRVIERERSQEQLAHHALHDSLTGLPNRALLLDRLQVALAQRDRRRLAVLFIDLDRFKFVNDSLGHEAGDQLLTSVATRLRTVLRPGDTVARFGGDEFVVLCEDVASEEDAAGVAERIASSLSSPFALAGTEVYVTASVGITVSGRGDDDAHALLRDADAALYRAKEEGRARHEVFDDVMRTKAVDRLDMANALHRALDNDELILHFQPQVDLDSGAIVGVEALVRWMHPQRGLIPPLDFIPLAEETGLIGALGHWVLMEACRQGRAWHDASPDSAPLTMSVNLSGRQLQQGKLVDEVREALRVTGFPAEFLVLEITETVLMHDIDSTLRTLEGLKDLGIRLAIDDFGTGYSSLTYLQRFPIDVLKIDKSFINGLGGDNLEESAVARTIVELAQALRLETVAEGVERPEHVKELRSLRCNLAQGFFFARPVTAEALGQLLLTGVNETTPVPALVAGV